MKATLLAVVVLAFSTHHAFAVSLSVKLACRDDYFAHCSMHAVGSPGVRMCMRKVGARLSSRCIGALADAGMIKGSKVASKKTHRAKTYAAKPKAAKMRVAKASARKVASSGQPSAARADFAERRAVASRSQARRHAERARAQQRYARRYAAQH